VEADFKQLAATVTTFLVPLLPALLAEEPATQEVKVRFGEATWEKAQALWARLDEKPQMVEAAEKLVAEPDDEDLRATFRDRLGKSLRDDPEMASALRWLLEKEPAETKVTLEDEENAETPPVR
jgi:hypothetical protein